MSKRKIKPEKKLNKSIDSFRFSQSSKNRRSNTLEMDNKPLKREEKELMKILMSQNNGINFMKVVILINLEFDQ